LATGLQLAESARRLDSDPLSDHVYRVLRDAICTGRIQPHTHLVQNQLADQLKVSRTPVRDALIRLGQEGLVRAIGARGFIVVELSPRDILDIFEVRMRLEVETVVAALDAVTPETLWRLHDINSRLAGSQSSRSTAYALNREFHQSLVELTPNRLARRILTDLWEQLVSRAIPIMEADADFDAIELAHSHDAILAALETKDPDELRSALSAHLMEGRTQAERWLSASRPAAG
jgi:DNA-binding GntR family transcriptional regulator